MSTPSTPAPAAPFIPPLIFQRDNDGHYQIGLDDDAPGPFETIQFAQAVAAERAQATAQR
jgi:hypothetical protein